jgi:CRAL/TRIO, N-terminal domain
MRAKYTQNTNTFGERGKEKRKIIQMAQLVTSQPQKAPTKPEEWGFPGFLTPDQMKALDELRERLLKENVFSKKSLMTDPHLLRFLRARDFNTKKAFDMIVGDLEWRKAFEGVTFKASDFPCIYKFANSGALYRAGYDVS